MKTAHNFAGPLFAVSLVVVILTFLRSNFPQPGDMAWVPKRWHVRWPARCPRTASMPARRVFWVGVFALGITVVASGLLLDKLVPGLVYTRGEMQIAHMVHAVAAMP